MTNNTNMTAQERDARNYEMMVAEEELILHAQMLIKRAMSERGISQQALAERLGVGASYINQMLGSSARNLTLRTIARAMYVLEQEATVVIDDSEAQLDAVGEASTKFASSSLAGPDRRFATVERLGECCLTAASYRQGQARWRSEGLL